MLSSPRSNRANPAPQPRHIASSPQILNRKAIKYCHIVLPDLPKPVSSILYGDKFYSYFRYYPTLEAAQPVIQRLTARGDVVVLTAIPKGLILWVFEPDARLVRKTNPRRRTIR